MPVSRLAEVVWPAPLESELGEEVMRMTWWVFIVIALLSQSGCLLNVWSSDPERRMKQMLTVSENLRMIEDEWERFWLLDQPSHLTPYRVHGGIQ